MKKIIFSFVLSLITLTLFSQSVGKRYDLYFINNTNRFSGAQAVPIGTFLRNDTIFISPGAIVNVINVQNEDSTWKSILLKPFREKPLALPRDTTIKRSKIERPSTGVEPSVQNTTSKNKQVKKQ